MKKYTGGGYITTNYKVSKNVYRYIWSLTDTLKFAGTAQEKRRERKKYHHFLAHIYASMSLQVTNKDVFSQRKGAVPIYSRLIDDKLGREFDPQRLVKIKVLEISPHDTFGKKSRSYRIPNDIFDEAKQIEQESIFKGWQDLKKEQSTIYDVNLVTGKRLTGRVKSKLDIIKHDKRDSNTPQLIRNSIDSLKPCPFNPKLIKKWVIKLENKFKNEKTAFNIIQQKHSKGSQTYIKAEKEYVKAWGRYLNSLQSMKTILDQRPTISSKRSKNGDLLLTYKAAYSIQKSGRITEIKGGFQTASRYFKHLFFADMQGMFFNYDLKSSQANILLQELEACKIRSKWLSNYLENPQSKVEMANRIGIPTDTWKRCFYALIMGAEIEKKTSFGAVFETLNDYHNGDVEKTNKTHKKFLKEVSKLNKKTKAWRDYIYRTKNKRYHYQHKGVKYWKNACDMHFKEHGLIKDEQGERVLIDRLNGDTPIKTKQGIEKCKRQLAAFMLQGQEACFIHHLTILCSNQRIPVYKNEHDGVITGKQIPRELINEAAELSGMKNAELEVKELCPKEERQEMRQYIKQTQTH